MNSNTENKRFTTSRGRDRSGVSSIEFSIIIALIIIILIGTVFVLGESTRDLFTSTASQIEFGTSGEPQKQAESVAAATSLDKKSLTFHFQLLAIAGAVCFSYVGYRYIMLAKAAAKANDKPNEESSADDALQLEPDVLQKILDKRTAIYNRMQDDLVPLFEGKSKVGTYMSRQLQTVRPNLAVDKCYAMLEEKGYRRFMVTDETGHMLGVVSKRDLQMKIGNVVADVMTDTPKVIPSNTCLTVGLTMLIQTRIACLPIVDNEILVGVLTRSDIVVVLQCMLTTLKGTFEEYASQQKNPVAPAPATTVASSNTPMPVS